MASNTQSNESEDKKRERRRWQLALRRYVIERNKSGAYARFFGLDIENFREWIALQFTGGLSWENFAEKWQFSPIVPISYFNFTDEADMLLCWNFLNIRVESLDPNSGKTQLIDPIAAKTYFEDLYKRVKSPFCLKMIAKIASIEQSGKENNPKLEAFLLDKEVYINQLSEFDAQDYMNLNEGMDIKAVLAEKELVRKFGG